MAKKKKKKSYRRKMTLPLTIALPLLSAGTRFADDWQRSGARVAVQKAQSYYTGYDPVTNKWSWTLLKVGAMSLIYGAIVHKVANATGINRLIASTGIPYVRL